MWLVYQIWHPVGFIGFLGALIAGAFVCLFLVIGIGAALTLLGAILHDKD
ncbi:putative membrane protein [Acinetobacter baumannii 1440422]|nr:putative membrane protein [Acinetobacter baumannii 1440422]